MTCMETEGQYPPGISKVFEYHDKDRRGNTEIHVIVTRGDLGVGLVGLALGVYAESGNVIHYATPEALDDTIQALQQARAAAWP